MLFSYCTLKIKVGVNLQIFLQIYTKMLSRVYWLVGPSKVAIVLESYHGNDPVVSHTYGRP